jgi:hypothetical protein
MLRPDEHASRKRPKTSGDDHAELAAREEMIQALQTSDKEQKETIQALGADIRMLMAAFTEAAEASHLQAGAWARNLYQSVLFRGDGSAGREATGFYDKLPAIIDALSQSKNRDDLHKALLRALVESQGTAGWKVAIRALIADTPSQYSIISVIEGADANALEQVLAGEELTATPQKVISAICSLREAAVARGGEVSQLASNMFAFVTFLQDRTGLTGQIRRITDRMTRDKRVPEHTPASGETPRSVAGGPSPPGSAGPPCTAAASASGGNGSTCLPVDSYKAAPTAPAPSPDVAPVATGDGPVQGLVVTADEDEHGNVMTDEPPEPLVLTADYIMDLIAYLKLVGKRERLLPKSRFFVHVRHVVAGMKVRVVPPSKTMSAEKQKMLSCHDPRCLTDEAQIRAHFM